MAATPTGHSVLHAYGIPRAGYLFPNHGDPGTPVGAATVSHLVNNHLHGLGIDATAPQCRHYFATEVYKVSRDIRLTQDLLGHRSPATTAIYAQVAPAESAAAIGQLPDLRV